MPGEAELQVAGPDALAKALADQGLEVGLIVDSENLDDFGHAVSPRSDGGGSC